MTDDMRRISTVAEQLSLCVKKFARMCEGNEACVVLVHCGILSATTGHWITS